MLRAPTAFGTFAKHTRRGAPKFDIEKFDANQDFGVEFGGGWEGAMRCLL
jgi:hypothetical protein